MSFAATHTSRLRRFPAVIQTQIRRQLPVNFGNKNNKAHTNTSYFKSGNDHAFFTQSRLSTLSSFDKVENKDDKSHHGEPVGFLERKNAKIMTLINNTENILSQYDNLSSTSYVTKEMATELLNQIKKWHQVTTSIVIPKEYNKRNRFIYLKSRINTSKHEVDELKLLKLTCAENMNKILKYHMKYNIPSQTSLIGEENDIITHPFSLVMDAWNQSASDNAGKMTAEVLESWGEVYGGDLTHAPTINEFNVVLDAHAKNASGDYDQYNNHDNGRISFPAELAWDTFSFLCQLNDVTLLPNATSCAYTISALSHHAFVMHYASQSFATDMHAEVAAIRAFSVWKRMLDMLKVEKDVDQALLWQAHSDILALSSHGLLRRDRNNGDKSQESILATVGQDTEALFGRMLQESKIYSDSINYIQQAYLSVMFAWSKQQEEKILNTNNIDTEELMMDVTRAALSAEALLVQMKESDLNPKPEHYHAVIKTYKNCLDRKVLLSDKRGKIGEDLLPHVSCLELLDEMEKRYLVNKDEVKDVEKKIAASVYEDVISSFVRSIHDGGPLSHITWADVQKVKIIFSRMMGLYERNLLWIETNRQSLTISLNFILRIYSLSETRTNRNIEESSAFLQRFCKLRPREGGRQNPNLATYVYYLSTLSHSDTKDAGSKALHVLKEMEKYKIKPNVAAYSLVIKIIGKRTDKIKTVEELINKAIEEYNSLSEDEKQKSDFNASALYSSLLSAQIRQRVNTNGYHLLNTLSEKYDVTRDPNLKPDIIFYGVVLDSLSRSKSSKSNVSRSLLLLDRIESMYKQGHSDLMPTKQCYTSVINTLSKSRMDDVVEQAEAILKRMELLYDQTRDESTAPDHITYSAVLRTISRSKLNDSRINRAEELMNIMEEKARKSEIPWPSAAAYTALIHCYKKSGLDDLGEKASLTIQRMDDAREHGNFTVKADTIAFNAAISAWTLSKSSEKAVKAWELLNEMCKRYEKGDISCKPSLQTFKQVLHVCVSVHSKEKSSHKDSVRVALQTQDKLLRNPDIYDLPDSEFFEKLIRVFGNNIPDVEEKQHFISVAFERCAKEGRVDHSILELLRRCSPQLYRNLPVVSEKVSLAQLPKDWWRNSMIKQ